MLRSIRLAGVDGRYHHRIFIGDEADMADERLVDDRVDHCRVVPGQFG
jgi:hypothetical protein